MGLCQSDTSLLLTFKHSAYWITRHQVLSMILMLLGRSREYYRYLAIAEGYIFNNDK